MTRCVKVYGVVQGVGFRPYAKRLADELGLAGTVRNCSGIVIIYITGDREALDDYVRRLAFDAPSAAVIADIKYSEIDTKDNIIDKELTDRFRIIQSVDEDDVMQEREYAVPVLSPDQATCDSCLNELYDSNNRRYMHPFISCTSCGPRYSILKDIPYDRDTTTMGDFGMCSDCKAEYTSIGDIRCHAQTIACRECGPKLYIRVYDEYREHFPDDIEGTGALDVAVNILNDGAIIAIKDIGGYHFACRTDSACALERLRALKRRESKSFAVMFSDVESIRKYAEVNEEEERCLRESARPIVLLKKLSGVDFDEDVCSDSSDIGAMLPCNPVQDYLVKKCGPLVMTSGNLGGEPIVTDDEKMKQLVLCKGIISAVLWHDRQILTPLDDSIVRVFANKVQMVRRARGYVPLPVYVATEKADVKILASGGDLKASFCYLADDKAIMSQYFGDLDDMDVCGAWKHNIHRLGRLHRLKPDILACDMHPRYYSSQIARTLYDYDSVIDVQHHHAHIASVIAEHGLNGKVIGVAFDGTGMGTDSTIWGGEVLLCEGYEFERIAHLEPVAMCGGDELARDATFSLICYLKAAGISPEEIYGELDEETAKNKAIINAAIDCSVGVVYSSSMGRLFDAVCALIGLRNYNTYEGECARVLERTAAKCNDKDEVLLSLPIYEGKWQTSELIRQIVDIVMTGGCETPEGKARVAYGFHVAIANAVIDMCKTMEKLPVALSGGVFMNRILLGLVCEELTKAGYDVYTNEKVPMNDGGIALGQSYIAKLKYMAGKI